MKKEPASRKRVRATVAAKYRKGASIRTLARKTNKSYGTVHNMLSESGVKFRDRGGPNHYIHGRFARGSAGSGVARTGLLYKRGKRR